MAHHHHEIEVEHYVFRPATRTKLFILLGAGVLLLALGLILAMSGGHEEGGHAMTQSQELVASTDVSATPQEHATEAHAEAEAGHHPKGWLERLKTSLWM